MDDLELHFGVNHLAHFLLLHLLLPLMHRSAEEAGAEGRVINVSCAAHHIALPRSRGSPGAYNIAQVRGCLGPSRV